MNAVVVFDLDGVDRAGKLDEYFQRRAPLDTLVLSAFVDRTCRYGVQMWYCGPDDPEHIAALHTALARATNAWMGEDRRGRQRPANGAGAWKIHPNRTPAVDGRDSDRPGGVAKRGTRGTIHGMAYSQQRATLPHSSMKASGA